MNRNNNDFDTEVMDYLSKKGYVRVRQLIQDLMKKHKRDDGKRDSGYSRESINRKLYSMRDRGLISILKYDYIRDLGIEEDDRRASYVLLNSIMNIGKHISKVIEKLDSTNPIQQKMALSEIERYEKMYVLTPNQLSLLMSKLNTENIDLVDHILRIVYNYLDQKEIVPSNRSEAIHTLRCLLERYPVPIKKYKNLRTHIIFLLGHFNDSSVIDRLKKDAEELDGLSEMRDYDTEYTANVIEEHRDELYDFEEKLRLEEKEEAAQFITHVRLRAMINLGILDDPNKNNNVDWGVF